VPKAVAGERHHRAKLYFGVEIEMEAGCAGTVDDVDNVVTDAGWWPKSDGSLACGLEAVSHPGTIRWWREPHRLAWLRQAADAGASAWRERTCGLHVHVSRGGLTPSAIAHMLAFFAAEPSYIAFVSRRRLSALRQWARIELDDDIGAVVRKARERGETSGRYVALNVCPPATVEVRVFRSTLYAPSVLRCIEWTHAVARWALSLDNCPEAPIARGMRPTLADFSAWLAGAGRLAIGAPAADTLTAWTAKYRETDIAARAMRNQVHPSTMARTIVGGGRAIDAIADGVR